MKWNIKILNKLNNNNSFTYKKMRIINKIKIKTKTSGSTAITTKNTKRKTKKKKNNIKVRQTL